MTKLKGWPEPWYEYFLAQATLINQWYSNEPRLSLEHQSLTQEITSSPVFQPKWMWTLSVNQMSHQNLTDGEKTGGSVRHHYKLLGVGVRLLVWWKWKGMELQYRKTDICTTTWQHSISNCMFVPLPAFILISEIISFFPSFFMGMEICFLAVVINETTFNCSLN